MSKYFFIGIKGSGMSAMAQIFAKQEHEIAGSDTLNYLFTQTNLELLNVSFYDYDQYQFSGDEIVIIGGSFNEEFSDVIRARAANCVCYYYDDMLALMAKKYTSIAVAGTHGKTTTTSMVRNCFNVGSKITSLVGSGEGDYCSLNDYFVFEACEYRNHFHKYRSKYAIITNVDYDHTDYFKTEQDYLDSFKLFAEGIENLVVCADDQNAYDLFQDRAYFYSIETKQFTYATNIVKSSKGTNFDLYIDGKEFLNVFLPIFGNHNILNFLAAITVCYLYDEDIAKILGSLDNFKIANRRFDEYFKDDYIVIDDYAHHYSEINALLDAVKQKYPSKKIVSVYQPISAFRLEHGLEEYVKALNKSDISIICEVNIPPRERDLLTKEYSSRVLLNGLNNGYFFDDVGFDFIKNQEESVIVFIGAAVFSAYTAKFLQLIDLKV